MLSHADDFPTFFPIASGDFPIPFPVSVDLRFPKTLLRLGKFEVFFTSVPKTGINEYDRFPFLQKQVGFSEPPESVF